ncbi:hypothetical protein ACFLZ5_05555 [Thermodesulfobacteriota bacterium]
MKLNNKALFISILLGLFVGIADTILDYIFFYNDENFFDLLILNVPEHEIYIRSVILFCFLIFGLIAGNTISRLQEALEKVKTLSDFLPICANCKKIRNDKGYWDQVEKYISDHLEVKFTHGICPKCAEELYPDLYNEIAQTEENDRI